MQLPMAESATQFLVDKLAEAMRAATKIIVEHNNFQVLADLLDSIKQVFIDLADGGDVFSLRRQCKHWRTIWKRRRSSSLYALNEAGYICCWTVVRFQPSLRMSHLYDFSQISVKFVLYAC